MVQVATVLNWKRGAALHIRTVGMLLSAFTVSTDSLNGSQAIGTDELTSSLEESRRRQIAGTDCGILALAAALNSIQRHLEASRLPVLLQPAASGLSFLDLQQAAVDCNVEAIAVKTASPEMIDLADSAAVVRLLLPGFPDFHFVAVVGSSGDSAQIVDFPSPPVWIRWSVLRDELGWDGNLLVLGRAARHLRTELGFGPRVIRALWVLTGLLFVSGVWRRISSWWRKPPVWPARLRNGFTIVEMLTVLTIVSVLIALLLPAVQAARERANRMSCQNKLRQLGLAIHSYADVHGGMFPVPFEPTIYVLTGDRTYRNLSWQAQVLPYLDLKSLYDRIDLREDGSGLNSDGPPTTRWNTELLTVTVPVFLCPSDDAPPGGINYRGSDGSRPQLTVDRAKRAFFGAGSGCYLSQITDGLSNTAHTSERVVGDRDPHVYHPTRDLAPGGDAVDGPDEQIRICQMTPVLPESHQSWLGASWLFHSREHTIYVHVFPPNSSVPDCHISVNARSWHPGGVNVLLCDGSVRFVSSAVTLDQWIALGSIRGGDSPGDF